MSGNGIEAKISKWLFWPWLVVTAYVGAHYLARDIGWILNKILN